MLPMIEHMIFSALRLGVESIHIIDSKRVDDKVRHLVTVTLPSLAALATFAADLGAPEPQQREDATSTWFTSELRRPTFEIWMMTPCKAIARAV